MSDESERPTYNPEPRTQGTSPRPCQNCGKYGHEHDKERVYEGNGRYSYNYVCEGN
jgi:hypothetical protein